MDIFPVSLKLQQQPCLIVGGGSIALRKATLLAKAGAVIHVVAPEIEESLLDIVHSTHGQFHAEKFNTDIGLSGYRLVIAATNDKAVNQSVFEACEDLNVLVNSVDDPPHCRFMVPAIIDRSPLVISVATNGASPVLARQIRTQLEAAVPHGMGKLADFSGKWRKVVKEQISNPDERRIF